MYIRVSQVIIYGFPTGKHGSILTCYLHNQQPEQKLVKKLECILLYLVFITYEERTVYGHRRIVLFPQIETKWSEKKHKCMDRNKTLYTRMERNRFYAKY